MGFRRARRARRRHVAGWLVAGGFGVCLAFAPAEADAEALDDAGAPPAAVAPEAESADAAGDGEEHDGGLDLETYWRQRLARAAKRIELAHEKAVDAEADYSRARHDRNPRGAALEAIKSAHTAAERELREAEAALPRLVEQARRAGVPPGVLRDYWDREPPEAPPATRGG